MITKINQLKTQTSIAKVQQLCESTIAAISSAIYNGVTSDAQLEIERVALTNLFEGLEKFSKDATVSQWLNNQKRLFSIKHLGVRKAVNTLMQKEGKVNPTISALLEGFKEKLDQDVPEVLLYEAFVSAMSGYNYLPAVHTELSAVGERVEKYKNDIDISKIIETMKSTRSNYLIPLIEDVVDNYLTDKNEQSKSSLKETLVKFSYDPFVRDILNIVMLDATQLQLEYSNASCDIEEKLFSPILYLGESEVLFNVKGTYYVKKGNFINKLKRDDIAKIDPQFKTLCESLNLPSVEISKKEIRVYMGEDSAVLTDNQTFVNGKSFTKEQINESMTAAVWAGNADLYQFVNVLRDNYDEIAELDFVKRVYLKENENYAADIFKLRDNIFITTFDPINNKTTFYRNINPIQAEKIMMEHMRFDVSKTFEDILPNKEKVLAEINETKKAYTDYINELQVKMEAFSVYGNEHPVATDVIKALQEELESVKNDFKNYLNEVQKFTEVSENLNITVQDDSSGKSYTVVVPTGAMAAKGEKGTGNVGSDVEGDEFGTEVGMASLQSPDSGASSAVTFDDDQSELISDEPSSDRDEVDLGADDLEAYADKVDAEAELETPEEPEKAEGGEGAPAAGGEGMELGDTGGEEGAELSLDDIGGDEGGEEETTEEEPEQAEEAVGAPDKNLEKTNFNKDKNPDDLDEPKKTKKVFLKRPKK